MCSFFIHLVLNIKIINFNEMWLHGLFPSEVLNLFINKYLLKLLEKVKIITSIIITSCCTLHNVLKSSYVTQLAYSFTTFLY